MIIIAHRGNSSVFPENTLEAYKSAIEMGADYIETDIWLSKDGVPVMLHDGNLKRTGGVDKNVADMTFDEIRRIEVNYAGKFGDKYTGILVPSVEEVLTLCRDTGARVCLEMKTIAACAPVKQLMEKTGFREDMAIILVWTNDNVREAYKYFKKAPIYYLAPLGGYKNAEDKDAYFKEMRKAGLRGLDVNAGELFGMPTEEMNRYVFLAKKYGMPIVLWTVDDEATMHRIFDTEVRGKAATARLSGITTNVPSLGLDIRKQRTGE
ncbi:MAG: hypothetical protein J5758_06010 [Abditibacteriota bacterium]|nr:hypothetical protein [Abditibacteriota bacterium]